MAGKRGKMENTANTVQIFCDGSSSFVPKHVGIGAVIVFRNETTFIKKGFTGPTCSFSAEVLAAIYAINYVKFKYGNRIAIQINTDQIDLVKRINAWNFKLKRRKRRVDEEYKRLVLSELFSICRNLDVVAVHLRYSKHLYAKKAHNLAYRSMQRVKAKSAS